jgi:hypothetical protein
VTTTDQQFEARLGRVLREGAGRLSVGRATPPLPTASSLIRPVSRRKRSIRRRTIGIGLGVSLALAGTAVAAATSTGPRVFLSPPAKASPTATPITDAVRSVLPTGASITGATHVQSAQSNYDDITAQLADGTTDDFTAYQHFATGDLDGFGLPKSTIAGGTLWIGSNDPTRRSVYYLNSAGIGVYVANSSAAGHAASMPAVISEAVRFAAALRSATAITTNTTPDGNAQPG